MVDSVFSQINQNTYLHIGYELIKKGRSFESIRFQLKQQQHLLLLLELKTDDCRLQMARQRLAELNIRDERLIEQILSEIRMIDKLLAFCYKLKTGKVKAASNSGGCS